MNDDVFLTKDDDLQYPETIMLRSPRSLVIEPVVGFEPTT